MNRKLNGTLIDNKERHLTGENMQTKFFTLIFVLLISVGITAQEKDTTWDYGDKSGHHNCNGWHFDDGDWEGFDFNFSFKPEGNPSINLLYGFGKNSLNKFNNNFEKYGLAEIKLGYEYLKESSSCNSLVVYDFNYLSISNFNKQLKGLKSSDKVTADAWRITLGWEDGYGYKFGDAAIIFYSSSGMGWTRFKFDDYQLSPALTQQQMNEDVEKLNFYHNTFRFGTKAEGGIKVQFIPQLSLDASYERFEVFPRHLFWKQVGSSIIEFAGQGLLDGFINKIKKSSPLATPIVAFVLKNALSYGIYELRKDKMNWPFNSTQPIITDAFKFGLTFSF